MNFLTRMPCRSLSFALLTLFLSACETTRGTREGAWPYPTPPSAPAPGAPVEYPAQPSTSDPAAPADQPQPEPVYVPPPRVLPSYPKTAEAISGAAVVSLLKQSRAARDLGEPVKAQAALERALRIEPRNYFIWSALAGTYLEQKNYPQAATVAQKSNSLARGNVYAEMENYRVIALAREAQGDAAGALQAQARVDEIQRLLQQP